MNWNHHSGEAHYELNYLISETTALAVRDHLQTLIHMGCLDVDERSVGQPNLSYPVHTIYLDSDDLTLYWQAANDHEHRKELRIRYYDPAPASPACLEIKRRLSDVVLRENCTVRMEVVPRVLSGEEPMGG